MDMLVTRLDDGSKPTGTTGVLSILQSPFRCDTLELPWLNNKTGESCVVSDIYKCWPWFSPNLKRLVLRLEDKHQRENCLVHNANFAGVDDPNTPEHEITQIHGCTAVGKGYGQIQKPNSTETQLGIKNSVKTLEALLEAIGEGPHTISYIWKAGCEPADLTDVQLNNPPGFIKGAK